LRLSFRPATDRQSVTTGAFPSLLTSSKKTIRRDCAPVGRSETGEEGEEMDQITQRLVIDITTKVTVKQDGSVSAAVERVSDSLGNDRTQMFLEFDAREDFNLTKQEQIEAAAGTFADMYGPSLP
ncbi:MAG: hypothetical protein RXS25_05055, partial [Paraburkholderia sp.]|uniref:hypothetical protein n=1 Tax=Paraburkholderia sp. TaxID=1926495 RepID=UPI00397D26BD